MPQLISQRWIGIKPKLATEYLGLLARGELGLGGEPLCLRVRAHPVEHHVVVRPPRLEHLGVACSGLEFVWCLFGFEVWVLGVRVWC